MGHAQTSRHVRIMSVIPLKADTHRRGLHVRLVPDSDVPDVAGESSLKLGSSLRRGRLRNRWRCGLCHVGTRQGIGFRRDVI